VKALFITGWLPLDPASASAGIFVRQRLFIDALKKSCDQIEVLYFAHHDPAYRSNEGSIGEMERSMQSQWGAEFTLRVCRRQSPLRMTGIQSLVRAATSIYWQPGYASTAGELQLASLNDALVSKPDLICVHRLASIPPLLKGRRNLPPVIFDLDDIEHVAFWRSWWHSGRRFRSLATLALIPAVIRAERAAIDLSTTTYVCSELDVAKLQRRFGTHNLKAAPNSVRIPKPIARSMAPRLLMLGNYAYAPNRQGIEFFVHRILPILRKAVPCVQLLVAGANHDTLNFSSNPPPDVKVLGFVDSLDALYPQATAVICPIFSGGGTRVKVIEAAAYGMPIVATRIGAEGIDLVHGSEILIADKPVAFAEACARVLTDSQFASRLSVAARRVAVARYDRNFIVDQLDAQFREKMRLTRR
jgi:glycosyltransferase involved in cell wall biosynthesis